MQHTPSTLKLWSLTTAARIHEDRQREEVQQWLADVLAIRQFADRAGLRLRARVTRLDSVDAPASCA